MSSMGKGTPLQTEGRLMLHATSLKITHPTGGERDGI